MMLYKRHVQPTLPTSSGTPGRDRPRPTRMCQTRMLAMKCLIGASILSMVSVSYWIYYTDRMEDIGPWIGIGSHESGFNPHGNVEVSDVIDDEYLLYFNDSRTAVFVFCGDHPAFDYFNYLSIASVMRFYEPSQTVILYEKNPPVMVGNWTVGAAANTVDKLLKSCPSFEGFVPMKSTNYTSRVCSDSAIMREFIMKLLLMYGGLYVGRHTFMTEVTSYLRVGEIRENILLYLNNASEGFIFVKNTVNNMADEETISPLRLTRKEAKQYGVKHVPVRVLTSREVRCFESETYFSDALHHPDGNSVYSCVVLIPDARVDPLSIISLQSDFGRFARKTVFNIHNDWETRYYVRVTNVSLVPHMCSIKDTDMGLNY